jgi:predicted porin
MKKTLIALAVAGTFAAPVAFAASANVDFYGKFRVSLDHVDVDGYNSVWKLNDQTSRVGFKGAEDLGGGLKAIYQYETGFSVTGDKQKTTSTGGYTWYQSNAGGLGAQRDTFVGLAGDFGTVLAGIHDTPYKMAGSADLFADTSADSQISSGIIGYDLDHNGIGGFDVRAANAIAYVSPSFSGLTLAAAIIPGETPKKDGAAHVNDAYANGLADAYSLAALYSNGPLSLSAGYEDHTAKLVNVIVGNTSINQKESAWKFNAGYTIDALKLGATYEDQTGLDTDGAGALGKRKAKNYLVSAAYGMGPMTLAAQYGKRNVNGDAETGGDNDLTRFTLGVVYSMSKRTSTYLAYDHDKYANGSAANNNASHNYKANVITLGLNHDF